MYPSKFGNRPKIETDECDDDLLPAKTLMPVVIIVIVRRLFTAELIVHFADIRRMVVDMGNADSVMFRRDTKRFIATINLEDADIGDRVNKYKKRKKSGHRRPTSHFYFIFVQKRQI
jgi:hypothetical protein